MENFNLSSIIKTLLLRDHPQWDIGYIQKKSLEYAGILVPDLAALLKDYGKTGQLIDYRHNEFSIFIIQALQGNCSYLDAILLMNEYIVNPAVGRERILRRCFR